MEGGGERGREGGRKIRSRGGGQMAWSEVMCLAKIFREEEVKH